jgi:16S rRNA (cytosine967-C5)-methyltransferase
MSSKFREHHLFQIFHQFSANHLPLDIFLRNYFKLNSSIGSHDRKFISEAVYGMIRWQGLLDYFCNGDCSWEHRYKIFQRIQPEMHQQDSNIPLHIRCSFPQKYFSLLAEALGEEKAQNFCYHSNYPAPITVRVNASKSTRDELLKKWEGQYDCRPGELSPLAIHFSQRINFFGLPEFKQGFFEVQDEASQLVSLEVQAMPGDHVLDYCSGSGGKTLAIAPQMKNKGQLYLHDIRDPVLIEAKKRLKRAGIQNAKIIHHNDKKKASLKNRMDWVLTDVPCSGSGTLRRNPDMKWKFDPNGLKELVMKQREIFAEAITFIKPNGHIVYSTCSVLPQENEQQIDYFLSQFPLKLVKDPFMSFPCKGKMDGFFAAVLQKN